MKKIVAVSALILIAAGSIFAQDRAVATVRHTKTEAIPESELINNIAMFEQQVGQPLSQEQKKEILEQMINAILIFQEAENDRTMTATEDEVLQASMGYLAQQLQMSGQMAAGGMFPDKNTYIQAATQLGINITGPEDNVRKQILMEKLIADREGEALQAIPRPTNEELAVEYQARVQEFVMSDSVYYKQIFFLTQGLSTEQARAKGAEARDVYQRLMNTSASFEELVASESEDEQSRAAGGDSGPVMKGDPVAQSILGPEFMDKIFSMGVGETSEPIQSAVGYHIIRITRKEPARLLPQDDPDVKAYLERLVYATKFQVEFEAARQRVADSIRESATIRYIGEYADW